MTTVFCSFLQRGHCAKGDSCKYKHSVSNSKLVTCEEHLLSGRTKNETICSYFQRGSCSRGTSCAFSHTIPSMAEGAKFASDSTLPDQMDACKEPLALPCFENPQPCIFFRGGNCSKGDQCSFSHEESVNLPASETGDKTINGKISVCKFFLRGNCQLGESCTYAHELLSENSQDIDKSIVSLPAMVSIIESFGEETLVGIGKCLQCKVGLGAAIADLKLVSRRHDTTRVCINGLLEAISDADIAKTLSVFGNVQEIIRRHSTYCYVVFEKPNEAEEAVRVLNGTSAKKVWIRHYVKLKNDVIITMKLAALPGSVVTQHSTVKVMWYTPTVTAWAHFDLKWQAKEVALRCEGLVIQKISISAQFQTPSRNQTKSFSVILTRIPEGISEDALKKAISNKTRIIPLSITFDSSNSKSGSSYNKHRCLTMQEECNVVRRRLELFGPLSLFDASIGDDSFGIKRKAIATFTAAEDASNAVNSILQDNILVEAKSIKLFIERVFTAKFSISLPIYEVVKKEVMFLLTNCSKNIRYKLFPSDTIMVLRLTGDSSLSISTIKSRLQRVFKGEKVLKPCGEGDNNNNNNINNVKRSSALWIDSFTSIESKAKFKTIGLQTNTYILGSPKRREVTVYGEQSARAEAQKALILFADEHFSIVIPASSLKAVLSAGISHIKTITGAASVSLDIIGKRMLVQGDKSVQELTTQFILSLSDSNEDKNMMLNSNSITDTIGLSNSIVDETVVCPICFCPPCESEEYVCLTNVVQLSSCGHQYCRFCFNMWMSQSWSGDSSCGCAFPLKCYSQNCGIPLRIEDLKVFCGDNFANLIRASLDEFILNNIELYQFCVTPDCDNIHSNAERVSYCSECSVSICTKCKIEEHEGLTCQENQRAKAPPDQENKILEEIFTLKCPRCRKAFLDFEGCFALKCSSCPCAFCAWCLIDCGDDAHPHVRINCSLKPKDPGRTYFGTKKEFEETSKNRIIKELNAYLILKEPTLRNVIKASLIDDLKDIDIPISVIVS